LLSEHLYLFSKAGFSATGVKKMNK
jgi:hypothetical protein